MGRTDGRILVSVVAASPRPVRSRGSSVHRLRWTVGRFSQKLMKTSFGICTMYGEVSQLPYEQHRLYTEAQKVYDQVLLINPFHVSYLFIRDQPNPLILHQGKNISSLTSLLVRGTKNSEAATAILVRALKICGCTITDPVERFAMGKASKLLTTLSRFQQGVGTSTYISFSRSGAISILKWLNQQGKLPLLTKPIAGSHGQGVELIRDLETGLSIINRYFGNENYLADPFYFQDFIEFRREYRIVVVYGEAIGIAEKLKLANTVVTNAAQGGRFVAVEAPDVVEAVLPKVSAEGVLGVDVAVDQNNQIHIIEANWVPQWQEFESATGIDVAKLIIDRILKRIH